MMRVIEKFLSNLIPIFLKWELSRQTCISGAARNEPVLHNGKNFMFLAFLVPELKEYLSQIHLQ